MTRNALILTLICCSLQAYGRQEPPVDTILTITAPRGIHNRILHYLKHTNEVKKKKKLDYSIIGGPIYTPETSLGIAAMIAAQYSTDSKDSLLPVSNIAIYASASLTGFYGIGINSTTTFPRDRFRLAVKGSFSSRPDKYWGIGYEAGNNKNDYTNYVLFTEKVQADFSMNLNGKLFAGIGLQVQNAHATRIDTAGGKPLMQPERLFGMGLGPFIVYDTRDFIPNPYKGVFVRLGYRAYPSFMGNKAVFSKFDLQFNWYRKLWKGAILATDLYGEEHSGDVPWNMMSEAGGSNRLRGYYEGRFRDRNIFAVQTELRQKICHRSGAVAWIGAGNVFPEFKVFTFSQSLISYGIGYRWEFKNRVNIRLDYGMGKDQSGFYFGINEVF